MERDHELLGGGERQRDALPDLEPLECMGRGHRRHPQLGVGQVPLRTLDGQPVGILGTGHLQPGVHA